MASVTIQVNGRDYDIACDEGQEDRVRALGGYVDENIRKIAGSGAVGGDIHLYVLTSLLMADEVFELREQLQNAGSTQQETPDLNLAISQAVGEREAQISAQIDQITEQVEKIVQKAGNA